MIVRISLLLLLTLTAAAEMPSKMLPDEVRGKKLYKELCWQCHGKKALGDGPQSKLLRAPALAGVVKKQQFPQLVQLIQSGKGLMPAYEQVIDRHDSKRILQWLHRLDKKTGIDTSQKSVKKQKPETMSKDKKKTPSIQPQKATKDEQQKTKRKTP